MDAHFLLILFSYNAVFAEVLYEVAAGFAAARFLKKADVFVLIKSKVTVIFLALLVKGIVSAFVTKRHIS